MKLYEEKFTVLQTECDLNERFTLGGILRATQQLGTNQCEALGVGTQYMLGFGTAWLLAKVSIEVYSAMRDGDLLRGVTEPSAPAHAVYQRYTSFYGEDGSLLAAVDARWVLADIKTRRILRRPPEGQAFPFAAPVDKEQPIGIVRAEAPIPCGEATATYSRSDLNRHLNNTHYADILCDALPLSVWEGDGFVKKAVLHYRSELPLGHTMQLSRGACDYRGAEAFYVVGTDGDTRCFEANLLF